MVAPPIQYARTEDNVNIAYWTLGEGPVLCHIYPPVLTHVGLEWQVPALRRWYESLAEEFTVLHYNPRCTALSDESCDDLSLSAMERDIDAVLSSVGASSVSFIATIFATQLAVSYAVHNPTRVAGLVLMQGLASGASASMRKLIDAAHGMSGITPEFWADAQIKMFEMDEGRDAVDSNPMRQLLVQSARQEVRDQFLDAFAEWEVRDDLGRVAAPTLVVASPDMVVPTMDDTRELVSGIPGAQLTIVPATQFPCWTKDVSVLTRSVIEFLRQEEPTPEPPKLDIGPFRTILFTDVVASTPLLAQLKDAKMRAVMHDHDAVLDAAVTKHGGRVVKEIGDAFMVEFAIPSAAVECAIAMQRGIQAQFADSDVPIRLRIGINAGEPVAEDGDLHGASVNIAKRLESAADTNGILVSDVVKQAVVGKDFEFADQGEVALKASTTPCMRGQWSGPDGRTAPSVRADRRWREHRLLGDGNRAAPYP